MKKIIHQTGPSNTDDWHALWKPCSESWKKQFSDWEYRFWNDDEIDNLVRTEYPEYYDMYNEFPVHIMKIDFVRFCMMHAFGGIYADLDYYCYANFEHILDAHESSDTAFLVENPYGNDPIENSLMASNRPEHSFWITAMDLVQTRWNEIKNHYPELIGNMSIISRNPEYGRLLRPYLVFYVSGTNTLSTAYRLRHYKDDISLLDGWHFNNSDISYDPAYFTRHVHTGLWGKENIEVTANNKDVHLRNIPLDTFDFYFDYSFGHYKKSYPGLDWSKNDVHGQPTEMIAKFSYE
jgi:hypothetical protein